MPSSDRHALALALVVALGGAARAQPRSEGFAVDRLMPSAAGAGWLVLDTLDMAGGPGGAVSIGVREAANPLRVGDGPGRFAAVTHAAFADVEAAVTWGRWRLSLGLDAPLAVKGRSGSAGGDAYEAPDVDLGSRPDTVADPRLGLDVRLLGEADSAVRLGLGARVIVPSGLRPEDEAHRTRDDVTDGTYRAVFRMLAAGDAGRWTWAGQLGLHLRPRDDHDVPGAPRGKELVFGVAAGMRRPLDAAARWQAVLGPEIFGATALRTPFGSDATSLEALLSARAERGRPGGPRLRVKLGLGAGLVSGFSTPSWRALLAVELSGPSPVGVVPAP